MIDVLIHARCFGLLKMALRVQLTCGNDHPQWLKGCSDNDHLGEQLHAQCTLAGSM